MIIAITDGRKMTSHAGTNNEVPPSCKIVYYPQQGCIIFMTVCRYVCPWDYANCAGWVFLKTKKTKQKKTQKMGLV